MRPRASFTPFIQPPDARRDLADAFPAILVEGTARRYDLELLAQRIDVLMDLVVCGVGDGIGHQKVPKFRRALMAGRRRLLGRVLEVFGQRDAEIADGVSAVVVAIGTGTRTSTVLRGNIAQPLTRASPL